MRPVRLVLEGFGPFRDRVEVDVADADLFALVGPTGSGKSSIIDGITFALYGAVARYDDERLVHPVINQRCSSALVDLQFTVGDTAYRATREVARTRGRGGTGASVKEARLEQGDDVLASGAKEVTAAVERLLGLSFAQFTTCVVLPQGEFARFLHESTRGREELLKRLLDLGLYDVVGQRARSRAKEAEAQVALLDQQLAEQRQQVTAEPEDLAARVQALRALLAEVDAAQAGLDARAAEAADATARARSAEGWVTRLRAVVAPEDLASRVEAADAVALELAAAVTDREAAERRVAAVEEARRALPDRAGLVAAADRLEQRDQLAGRVEAGASATADAEELARGAAETASGADADLTAAEAALAAAEREHAAHTLAVDLVVGEPCPVCHQQVDELPRHDLADLTRLRDTVTGVRAVADRARLAATDAAARAADYRARLETLQEELAGLAERIQADPPAEQLADDLARWEQAEADEAAARAALQAARDREKEAGSRRDKLDKLLRSAWDELDEVRDPVVPLGPPAVDRDDLGGAWAALVSWAADAARAHQDEAAAAAAVAGEAARRAEQERAALVERCRAVGVGAATTGPLRDPVVQALAEGEADLRRAEDLRRQQAAWLDQRDQLEARRRVADELGRLLRSGGFVTWLLDEAVGQLVAGATRRLHELSRGRYSLVAQDKAGFLVIDHHNADEPRLARSLSGGETFLAALALALALADEVARLSSVGAPRLESIFVDEGFGTLDPETLDVVVSAIEELQATGRMVGLVSHVPEVAERVPVRFEVRKDPVAVTSTVERVLA